LSAFFIGLIIAIIIGVVVGIAVGGSKKLEAAIKPYVFALNSLPLVAIIPLMIIWFGIGAFSKTVVVFLVAVIPIIISVSDGVKTVDQNLVKMAESFGASKIKVIFFHSLPNIISGIRIAVGRALVGLLAAEFFGFGKGIGYLISLYGSTFEVNKMMALVLLVIAFNILMIALINITEKKLVHWT
jgi:NitT/TauT family transport system permease protein